MISGQYQARIKCPLPTLALVLLQVSCNYVAKAEALETEVDKAEVDWIVLTFMALIFAYLVSLFGFLYGYIAYIDDTIMQRYQKHAVKVEADVRTTEFTRGGQGGDVCFQADQKQYCVVVEYNHMASPVYRIRIKKQLQAFESDFIHPHHPELNKQDTVDEQDVESPEKPKKVKTPRPKVIFNQDSFFQSFLVEERKLEMLVLQQYAKSGLSSRQVKRRLGFQYRLSAVSFVVSSILLTLFCFRMAFQTINDDDDESHQQTGYIFAAIFAGLIMLQLPCIHFFLGPLIRGALEEEYFETGEVLQTGQDDSSLSSGSSDVYLGGLEHDRSLTSICSSRSDGCFVGSSDACLMMPKSP